MITSAVATNYLVTVQQLTAHNAAPARDTTVAVTPATSAGTLTPLVPYAPFFLCAILFVLAFGIFIVNRVLNTKNIITAFLIALMISGIPTVLTYVSQGSRQTANAGPDETPRTVQVTQDSPSSVIIKWETDARHEGGVRLSTAPMDRQIANVYVADDRGKMITHTVHVGDLTSGHSYEFEILSGSTWYDNGGKFVRFTML